MDGIRRGEVSEFCRVPKRASTALPRGANLDVPGRALIARADDRIRWHEQTADLIAAELKTMSISTAMPATAEVWRQQARKTDLERKMISSATAVPPWTDGHVAARDHPERQLLLDGRTRIIA